MIIGIVAIAKNYAIGKGGQLPWHYSADLKFFKETTMGQAMVMGSTTWASIGRPLPGRHSIVLSRRPDFDVPAGVMLVDSKQAAIDATEKAGLKLYVIGGAAIFKLFADDIQKWIVTEVPVTIEDADVFMPSDFLDGFELQQARDIGDDLTVKTYIRGTSKLM